MCACGCAVLCMCVLLHRTALCTPLTTIGMLSDAGKWDDERIRRLSAMCYTLFNVCTQPRRKEWKNRASLYIHRLASIHTFHICRWRIPFLFFVVLLNWYRRACTAHVKTKRERRTQYVGSWNACTCWHYVLLRSPVYIQRMKEWKGNT